jgi:hypothetical protein
VGRAGQKKLFASESQTAVVIEGGQLMIFADGWCRTNYLNFRDENRGGPITLSKKDSFKLGGFTPAHCRFAPKFPGFVPNRKPTLGNLRTMP